MPRNEKHTLSPIEIQLQKQKAFQKAGFLLKNLPDIFSENEAGRLELALNSESESERDEANKKVSELIKTLINNKADPLVLMAIKLHADLFKPVDYPESSPFVTVDGLLTDLEPHRTNSSQIYKEALLEVSRKEQNYFMAIYTQTLIDSDMQPPSSPSSLETIDRKLQFLKNGLLKEKGIGELSKIFDAVALLFHRTPHAYGPVMLLILDLHRKTTANNWQRRIIRKTLNSWKYTLKWDDENLNKQAYSEKSFIKIANEILSNKLGFRLVSADFINNLSDIAQAFDKLSGYRYNPSTRKKYLEQIEKEMKASISRKLPKPTKSKNKQRTPSGFRVSEACRILLTNKTIDSTQAAAIETVIEYLRINKKTALKDFKACIKTPAPQENINKISVRINNATDKKIESLRKAFQLSRSSLLEFAVNYHEQTNQYRTEQNQQQLNKDTKASLTSKNSGPIKNLDELRRARQQSIEHQTEHPQSQISTNEQLTATQKSIDGEKAQITNPQLSVNNNELKNTEQLERHPKPAKDEPMLEHSQLTEAEQPLETLNQGSKPHTQHIMDKLRRQKQQKEKNRKKNKNRKVKR